MPNCEKEALVVAAAMEKEPQYWEGPPLCFEYFPGRGLTATVSCIESVTEGNKLRKSSLGSVEFITSLFESQDQSREIKNAVNSSLYGNDFVHALLSLYQKVTLIHLEDQPHQPFYRPISLNLRHVMIKINTFIQFFFRMNQISNHEIGSFSAFATQFFSFLTHYSILPNPINSLNPTLRPLVPCTIHELAPPPAPPPFPSCKSAM